MEKERIKIIIKIVICFTIFLCLADMLMVLSVCEIFSIGRFAPWRISHSDKENKTEMIIYSSCCIQPLIKISLETLWNIID